MSEPAYARLEAAVAALAHPTRRHIIVSLAVRGPMTAGQVADRFRVAWPTITRHLGVLEAAGVVRVTATGRNRVYALDMAALECVSQWLDEVRAICARTDAADPDENGAWRRLGYANMQGPEDGEAGETGLRKKKASR